MADRHIGASAPARKSALLLLLNLCLLGCLFAAWYYGALAMIWRVDVLKLSFVVIALYFVTAFALTFDLIGDDLADNIEGRLPMIALCGTVYGILTVFQVLAGAKLGSAADFKNLIGPLLAGGGTAMWPTFLALLGSNLLWAQLLVRRIGVDHDAADIGFAAAVARQFDFRTGEDDEDL